MPPNPRPVVVVDSPDNPSVKLLRELHSRESRQKRGAFLIEGSRLVAEAVEAGWPLEVILYDAERADGDSELSALVARIPRAARATPRAMKQACDTVSPQGIVAAARMPRPSLRLGPSEPLVLVLDGIADPGNAGTLLRSALGAGVSTVLSTRGTVDLFSPKVVRSGMGAHFRLKLGTDLAWSELEAILGKSRPTVVAEARSGDPYYSLDWTVPATLVIGSEIHGPALEGMSLPATRVAIPLDPWVESLNAGVAGSIILFEAKRQRERR